MILPLSNCDSSSYCLRKRRNGMSTSALPLSKIGKQLPKVGMPGKDFWRRSGPTQSCRVIEEEKSKLFDDTSIPH
ncbi:hypothetical protein TNCV_4057951 [Trichonephila clavipes]|nr:hypothetical protein TNCV_4057951 [Trichonephila clavipes]